MHSMMVSRHAGGGKPIQVCGRGQIGGHRSGKPTSLQSLRSEGERRAAWPAGLVVVLYGAVTYLGRPSRTGRVLCRVGHSSTSTGLAVCADVGRSSASVCGSCRFGCA